MFKIRLWNYPRLFNLNDIELTSYQKRIFFENHPTQQGIF